MKGLSVWQNHLDSAILLWVYIYSGTHYHEVLGTMKIILLYQVSHYIRVKKQRNYEELGPAILPCYKRLLTRFHCITINWALYILNSCTCAKSRIWWVGECEKSWTWWAKELINLFKNTCYMCQMKVGLDHYNCNWKFWYYAFQERHQCAVPWRT